ncbi:MAG: hypothetical protein ACK4SO_04080 [Candidatus Kapaibacteriota bacterium]
MDERIDIDALKFFAKITSGYTHELNNIVAIINELNGNIEDKIRTFENIDPTKVEKVAILLNKIAKQLDRAKSLTKSLNRFAHTVDSEIENVDIAQLVKDSISLFRYFVKLSNANIVENYTCQSHIIRTNPFLLFFLLFKCVWYILQEIDNQRNIVLSTAEGKCFKIFLSCYLKEHALEPLESFVNFLNQTANPFGIELKTIIAVNKAETSIEITINNINKGELR